MVSGSWRGCALLLAAGLATCRGMELSIIPEAIEMLQLELGTTATAQLMAEEVYITDDQQLTDKLSCPTSKVACPLCYSMVEHWNSDGKLPPHADVYCTDVVSDKWRVMYQTLTGKPYVDLREKTRCIAIAAGLGEAVRQGCDLPSCQPEVACSPFC